MFKKIIQTLVICPLLLASSFLSADQLPNEFTVTERWLSWTTTFDIETTEGMLGTVHRSPYSLVPEYHLMDNQENLMAKARMRFLSLLTVFDVEDQYRNSIGSVQQQFTFFFPTIKIISPTGRYLGQAVLNFWGTTYTVSDPTDGHTIAEISRPFLRLKSNWTVKIIDQAAISEKNIHPHLFLTLIAFQVDKEYWDAERRRREAAHDYDVDIYIDYYDDDYYDDDYYDDYYYYDYASVGQNKDAKENTKGHSEEEMVINYRDQLDTFRVEVENLHPTPEDFKAVESMTNDSNLPADKAEKAAKVQSHMDRMFGLMSSKEISTQQKAALFLMMKSVLEQPTQATKEPVEKAKSP